MRETTIDTEFRMMPGEFMRLTPGYLIERWQNEQGENCRFVDAPDPDSEPEFGYEGMFWDEIVEDIEAEEYERRRAWEQDEYERNLYNSEWF